MKSAIVLSLFVLLLFGPWFVFLAERKQIRWFKPFSYLCLFLGPALFVLGIVNYCKSQAKKTEIIKAGGTVKTIYTTDSFGPGPKSPPQTPDP